MHWRARGALYDALPLYAANAFARLADAAANGKSPAGAIWTLDEFLGALNPWLASYEFVPDPSTQQEWLEWFTNDALDSFVAWYPDEGPYRITAALMSDVGLDLVEAEALVRVALADFKPDEHGNDQPRIKSAGEIVDALCGRFVDLISPRVDEMLERAKELGVDTDLPPTLDDDMRRFVLKHFRRLKNREIAAAENRGDSGVADEHFTQDELARVTDTEERNINRSIKRAADRLGAPARKHRSGPEPRRSARERRS